jgi:hypothetical protein
LPPSREAAGVFALQAAGGRWKIKREELIAVRAASFASFRRSGGKEGKRRSVSGSVEVCGELGLKGRAPAPAGEAPPDKRRF